MKFKAGDLIDFNSPYVLRLNQPFLIMQVIGEVYHYLSINSDYPKKEFKIEEEGELEQDYIKVWESSAI